MRHHGSEVTTAIGHDVRLPSSHNILLYEDGHAVVADFGGEFGSFQTVQTVIMLDEASKAHNTRFLFQTLFFFSTPSVGYCSI